MNNQIILWSLMLVPWLTLFLMKKEEIRRYLPVGIFSALSSIVIVDIGLNGKFWVIRENIFPLVNVLPYHLGAVPVITMWLFKYTYGNVYRYISLDAINNLVFAFLMIPWLVRRGIFESGSVTGLSLFLITTIHGFILYVYQIVQEGALITTVKNHFSMRIQPASTKPIIKDKDEERDDSN